MKQYTVTKTSLEEAYIECENTLKATRDKMDFEVLEEGGNYTVTATLKINYPIKGLEYLKSILEGLGIKAVVEMRKKQSGEIRYVITSDENPILIGKGGKTLESIQTLVRYIVNGDCKEGEERFQISVDCGGYKESRLKHLEILATKTAKEVAQSKIPAHLEPMNSYERRIIHAKLADWRDVITESEGDGKDRHIVIKPKAKSQDNE